MSRLRHPNIIKFKEIITDKKNDYCHIIMEYADGGDLNEKIKSQKSYFQEEQILNSTYSYYTFNNESSIFKGNLTIKVINGEGALIESLFAYDENNFEVNMKTYNSSTHSFTNAETYVGDYAIYRSAQKGVGTSRIVVN